jgi:hypothetical protein
MREHLSSTSFKAQPVQRYKVVFHTMLGHPTWEGYATSEMEAKLKAGLWLERVHVRERIKEASCERIKEV